MKKLFSGGWPLPTSQNTGAQPRQGHEQTAEPFEEPEQVIDLRTATIEPPVDDRFVAFHFEVADEDDSVAPATSTSTPRFNLPRIQWRELAAPLFAKRDRSAPPGPTGSLFEYSFQPGFDLQPRTAPRASVAPARKPRTKHTFGGRLPAGLPLPRRRTVLKTASWLALGAVAFSVGSSAVDQAVNGPVHHYTVVAEKGSGVYTAMDNPVAADLKVEQVVDNGEVQAYSASMTTKQAGRLRDEPGVAYVVIDNVAEVGASWWDRTKIALDLKIPHYN